jgi:hypothetical protein
MRETAEADFEPAMIFGGVLPEGVLS